MPQVWIPVTKLFLLKKSEKVLKIVFVLFFLSGPLLLPNSVNIDENTHILLLVLCSWNVRFSTKSSLKHKLLTL